jgi:hypothetical protein
VTREVPRPAMLLGAVALLAAIALGGHARASAQTGAGEAGTAGSTRAVATGDISLSGRMLETADLPAGFRPYAPLTGPLTGRRVRLLGGVDGRFAPLLHGWVRDWVSVRAGEEVREEAFDAGTGGHARSAMAGFDSSVSARGLTERHISAHLDGFRSNFRLNNAPYTEITVPLARGPYFFIITVLAPAQPSSSAIRLETDLVAAQSRKVPEDTPDTGTSLAGFTPDTYHAAGLAVGALLGYLAIVSGIAYLRNPLRRARRRGRSQTAGWPDGQQVLDVSGGARKYRNAARLRLAVQVVGLSVTACGADPFAVTNWYIFVLAGAAIVWAGGRFIHPAGPGLARNRAVLSGSRRVRVTLIMSLASAMVIVGALLLIGYGLNQSEPPAVVAVSAASGSPLPSQDFANGEAWLGIALVAVGAVISRRARRLASVEARRMMQRDTRPPVLYLRSFGDDGLKLWTATLGRPSLIERFTPRRFDAFEEVLVRHLSLRGPVIALNPPGTKLAPLGAARETIDSADWQSAIAAWMERSALIVFVAPPGEVTQGLLWELESVSASSRWDKTLIVVPPVPPPALQRRWEKFLEAWAKFQRFTFPVSAEDPGALVVAFRNGKWTVFTADRRTEWSYGAALGQALGDSPQASEPAEPDTAHAPRTSEPAESGAAYAPPAAARRRLLTLPMAALAVVIAAAAGAGSWYAVREASAASRPPTPAPSVTPSPPPSSEPAPTPSSPSPPHASSQPQTSPASGLVSLAPAAAQYPGAASIQPVITEYFQGINSRNYAEYGATESPGQALTLQQFQTGFRSTEDSNVIVTSITTAPDGRPAADVTFTSRQQPQDGPSGESCTNWQITMFFDGNAGTYTIGAPAAGYAASYQACS